MLGLEQMIMDSGMIISFNESNDQKSYRTGIELWKKLHQGIYNKQSPLYTFYTKNLKKFLLEAKNDELFKQFSKS